jgi:hypothetical protein
MLWLVQLASHVLVVGVLSVITIHICAIAVFVCSYTGSIGGEGEVRDLAPENLATSGNADRFLHRVKTRYLSSSLPGNGKGKSSRA